MKYPIRYDKIHASCSGKIRRDVDRFMLVSPSPNLDLFHVWRVPCYRNSKDKINGRHPVHTISRLSPNGMSGVARHQMNYEQRTGYSHPKHAIASEEICVTPRRRQWSQVTFAWTAKQRNPHCTRLRRIQFDCAPKGCFPHRLMVHASVKC